MTMNVLVNTQHSVSVTMGSKSKLCATKFRLIINKNRLKDTTTVVQTCYSSWYFTNNTFNF